MVDDPVKPKRRPRYKGTHPRAFKQKYKELNPERYPEEIKKAVEAGKTPAGTHRPICMTEILDFLKPRPGLKVVDATLGYGGHTTELLKRITPGGLLLGFDVDTQELPKTEARIRAAGFNEDVFIPCQANYDAIPKYLREQGLNRVHLVLADLGVSSMQLDNPERGFSFKLSGPLDLQMNPLGKNSASQFLKDVTEKELVQIFEENADEVFAEEIARSIVKIQRQKPITTTEELTFAINEGLKTLPPRRVLEEGNKPIRRVFQAIRIAVNHEFDSLEIFLENLPEILVSGGRAAILTFHSGEDRRVKKAFKEGHKAGIYREVARDVIRPTPEEVRSNPRASSAKLRWAVRA